MAVKCRGVALTAAYFTKKATKGQTEDAETGFNAFELRLYDARIGGWLSPDPYQQHHSPYMAMSNNPLSFIDPDGGKDNWIEGGGGNRDFDVMGGEGWGAVNDHLRSRFNNVGGGGGSRGGGSFGSLASRTWRIANGCTSCSGSQVARYAFSYSNGTTGAVMNQINYEISAQNLDNYTVELKHEGGVETYFGFTAYNIAANPYLAVTLNVQDHFGDPQNHFSSLQHNTDLINSFATGVGSLTLLSENYRAVNRGKFVSGSGRVYSQRFYGNQHTSKWAIKAAKANSNKIAKLVGRAGNGMALLGVSATLYDGITNENGWQNHHTADLVVTGAIYGTALAVPVVGWVAGGAYFIADITTQYYTGKSITQNLFDP